MIVAAPLRPSLDAVIVAVPADTAATIPVDVTVVGNGTVGRVPDQALYDVGSSVELTATPADHWHFAGWSGDASGATNPLTITVDAAKNVTATFAPDQFALDVAVVGNGTVAKNPDQPS